MYSPTNVCCMSMMVFSTRSTALQIILATPRGRAWNQYSPSLGSTMNAAFLAQTYANYIKPGGGSNAKKAKRYSCWAQTQVYNLVILPVYFCTAARHLTRTCGQMHIKLFYIVHAMFSHGRLSKLLYKCLQIQIDMACMQSCLTAWHVIQT